MYVCGIKCMIMWVMVIALNVTEKAWSLSIATFWGLEPYPDPLMNFYHCYYYYHYH